MYTDYILYKEALDIENLKRKRILGDAGGLVVGKTLKIEEHLANLYKEFASKSELEFFHAYLIVHLRRDCEQEWCIEQFNTIWDLEHKFLCAKLSTRWLVSACDTMIDYPTSESNRIAAMATTLFLNTIKLYETENLMLENKQYTKNAPLPRELELFDGITPYAVGKGDMIKNLLTRINAIDHSTLIAYKILREIIKRATHEYDTVYSRMLKRHLSSKTYWGDLL